MSVPADCSARNEKKTTSVKLMLAASDQCFIKRFEIRVHIGSWSERALAQV